MSATDASEGKMTLQLVVPIELKARWTADNTDDLVEALLGSGFGPEGPNLRIIKNGSTVTAYVCGTGLPEQHQEAVVAAIEGYLVDEPGFQVMMRQVRLEEL